MTNMEVKMLAIAVIGGLIGAVVRKLVYHWTGWDK